MTNKNPFKLISTTPVYKNPWITVREDKVIRPGGKQGIFGVIQAVSGSTVLPINHDGNVLLVKEYKYGISRVAVEAISGSLDEGETPLQAAKRELREEAGIQAEEWIALGSVDPLPTICESQNYLFLAKNLDYFDPHPDEGEIIETVTMPFTKALAMVKDGTITHAGSCVLILRAQDYVQDS